MLAYMKIFNKGDTEKPIFASVLIEIGSILVERFLGNR